MFVVHEEAPKSIPIADSEKVKNVNCCEFNVLVGSEVQGIAKASHFPQNTIKAHRNATLPKWNLEWNWSLTHTIYSVNSVLPVQFRMPPYLDAHNLNLKNIHSLKKCLKDYYFDSQIICKYKNYIFMDLCIVDQI